MSLVQHINRKRPRAFRTNNSATSSPRNSSTPMFKSATAAIANATGLPSSNTSSIGNPFAKNGVHSSDPICLDSEDDSDAFERPQLSHSSTFQKSFDTNKVASTTNGSMSLVDSIMDNTTGASSHYDSDDSLIIVEERKVSDDPELAEDNHFGSDNDDDAINPFSSHNAINEYADSRYGSFNSDKDTYFKPSSYHSDSSFNPALYSMQNGTLYKNDGPHSFDKSYYDILDRNMNGTADNYFAGDIFNKYSYDNMYDKDVNNIHDVVSQPVSPVLKRHKKNSPGIIRKLLPQVPLATVQYEHIVAMFPKVTDVAVAVVPSISLKKPCDEENGHFKVEVGKSYANNRFLINKLLGQGTFGKVVEAYDNKNKRAVAIKIIKAVPKYREAAKIELRVLSTIKNFDRPNKNGCIHLREVFDYRNHISLITDLLSLSVFDFFDSNNFKSFPGSHIQSFAKQLLRSVNFLHDLNIIHTDLKPENILLMSTESVEEYYFEVSQYSIKRKTRKSSTKNSQKEQESVRRVLKNTQTNLIDFGSAIFNNEFHPELVSTRHYRAPEIAFGIGWSYECDLWSVGCILVELLIGEALFNTHDNREHLLMMEKITNEKLDLNLIRNCCIQSQKQLRDLREARKPYPNFGNHYINSFTRSSFDKHSDNGYGSVPVRFSSRNVNRDVLNFLQDRGESYLKLSDDALNGLAYHTPASASGECSAFLQSEKPRAKKRGFESSGLKKIKQKFPKECSTKVKKAVSDLLPIEEMIGRKVGLNIDLTLSVDEAYFKYCLDFCDAQQLLDGIKHPEHAKKDTINTKLKNLHGPCGGCLNEGWLARALYDKYRLWSFEDLKQEIMLTNAAGASNPSQRLNDLITEAQAKQRTAKDNSNTTGIVKQLAKYPDSLEATQQTFINKETIGVEKRYGPVDKETFRFWYLFTDLVKSLLTFNPYNRLTAHEALNHPWFSCGIYDDGTLDHSA